MFLMLFAFHFKLIHFLASPNRFSDEMELRHTFNVTGCEGNLPQTEVPGFRSAVDELARDFKQLATMLLAVIMSYLFGIIIARSFLIELIVSFSAPLRLSLR